MGTNVFCAILFQIYLKSGKFHFLQHHSAGMKSEHCSAGMKSEHHSVVARNEERGMK